MKLFRREAKDAAADEEEWRQELEDELQELRDAYDAEYVQRVHEYQQRLERWKQQRLEKVSHRCLTVHCCVKGNPSVHPEKPFKL